MPEISERWFCTKEFTAFLPRGWVFANASYGGGIAVPLDRLRRAGHSRRAGSRGSAGAQPLVGVAGADCSARGPGQRPVGLRASARARYLCTSSRESVARLPAVVLHYDAHACIAICLELLCTGAHRDGAARAAGDEVRALRRR